MMNQIHLADRRGLLTGDLSRVQQIALEVTMLEAQQVKIATFFDNMRMSIISTDPSSIPKLYPSLFAEPQTPNYFLNPDRPQSQLDKDLANPNIVWKFGGVAPEEAERLLAEMAQGQVSGQIKGGQAQVEDTFDVVTEDFSEKLF